MPRVTRRRCRVCSDLGILSAQRLCVGCQELAEDLLLVEAERYIDIQDAVLALAAAYSRAREMR